MAAEGLEPARRRLGITSLLLNAVVPLFGQRPAPAGQGRQVDPLWRRAELAGGVALGVPDTGHGPVDIGMTADAEPPCLGQDIGKAARSGSRLLTGCIHTLLMEPVDGRLIAGQQRSNCTDGETNARRQLDQVIVSAGHEVGDGSVVGDGQQQEVFQREAPRPSFGLRRASSMLTGAITRSPPGW